jgi:hypothetical protein
MLHMIILMIRARWSAHRLRPVLDSCGLTRVESREAVKEGVRTAAAGRPLREVSFAEIEREVRAAVQRRAGGGAGASG